jgi:dimethylhistidine N-methyltransferase
VETAERTRAHPASRTISQSINREIVAEALAGLFSSRKTLPPKLFYDEAGCALFGEITRLSEYYLTRTERAILEALAPALDGLVPRRAALVEYGASNEAKAELLFAACEIAAYVPIDIAADALAMLSARLADKRPALAVHPIIADFLTPIVLPHEIASVPRLGFFPGSTIGNLDPGAAIAFLARARATLGEDATFLVGVDLEKPPDLLVAAYDDAAGITAAFNRNMLARLNREAGADFVLAAFAHRAVWNPVEHRIEMHLESLTDQIVHIAGTSIPFREGETIHTENSYKFTVPRFTALAMRAGWRVERIWTDRRKFFAIAALR